MKPKVRAMQDRCSSLTTDRILAVTIVYLVLPASLRADPSPGAIELFSGDWALNRLAPDTLSGSADFQIDDAGSVIVLITATSESLDTSIEAPGNQVLDPANIGGFGGEFAAFSGSSEGWFLPFPFNRPGYQYLYTFPSLGAGTYSVCFEADPGVSGDVAVITEVITDSPVRANLFCTEPELTLGRTAVLTSAVFENASPKLGAVVTVSVKPPTGDAFNLILLDDGLLADDVVGDGLYSGLFTTGQLGVYQAVAEITGLTSLGTSFKRVAGADVLVVEQGADFFASSFTDHGEDDNGNGLFERLVITAPVTVSVAGEYILTVILETSGGQHLLGYGAAQLTAISQSMNAAVLASAIRAANENGPYAIIEAELVFVGEDGAVPSDRLVNGTQLTQAYLVSQFERPPIVPTGVNSDSAVDTDADTDFDRLDVQLGIDVLYAGNYQYSVSLWEECSGLIQFVNGEQTLAASPAVQSVSFSFSGSLIGAHGVNGPYLVRDLLIYGPASATLPGTIDETQAYAANQFNGFAPASDCDNNGTADLCDIFQGGRPDCNFNGLPDDCDFAAGAMDCNGNGTPDECDGDCNGNGLADVCDLTAGTSIDCDANGVPDECQPECNDNGIADACDLAAGTSQDCDNNGVPDECEADCNRNGIVDACDIAAGTSEDCNADGSPDECTTPGWAHGFSSPGLSGVAFAFAVFDDGTGPALYVGGGFTTAGGITVNGMASWDGLKWSSLESGVGGTVYALAVIDDGTGPALYAGGTFTSAGGTAGNRVAKWDGFSWSALGSGTGNTVFALADFDDGTGPSLYAGGSFITAGGATVNRIAKWNPATGTWSPLGSGMAGCTGFSCTSIVLALAVFDPPGSDGPGLYAGGNFITAGGTTVSHVARWNGSSWSAVGGGMDGKVEALTVFDPPGPIGPGLYAGGGFSVAGQTSASRIARWDGTSWSALESGTSATVYALGVFDPPGTQLGPTLHVGGEFDTAGGLSANNIAEWDGANWSTMGTGTTSIVRDFAVFDPPGLDGGPALYIGGNFLSANEMSVQHIAQWDGTNWSSLGQGLSGTTVKALATFDDGSGPSVYAGGEFYWAGGLSVKHIAEWDGATWSRVGTGVSGCSQPFPPPNCTADIRALAAFDPPGAQGAGLYAGGDFTSAGGAAANHIARWDGATWSPLATGTSFPVECLLAFDPPGAEGAGLYMGGWFASAGGVPGTLQIAKWDGVSWSALGSGVSGGGGGGVHALAAFDDGAGAALYAGGFFTTAGGVSANRVAEWDGLTWSALADGLNGTNNSVRALAVFDPPGPEEGAGLYAAGYLTSASGTPVNHIARWDGSTWSSVGNGANSAIETLAVFDDGMGPALYAGGQFTVAGGVTANHIARWDGANWAPVTTGTNDYVWSFAEFDSPEDSLPPSLFVGGEFTIAGGTRSGHIAEWRPQIKDCNHNGVLDDCDLDCNGNSVPDECETAAATLVGAVSRKFHDSPISANQNIVINLSGHVEQGNVTSESRNNGITELRLTFDVSPGGPCGAGPAPVTILQQSCSPCPCGPGQQASYQPSVQSPPSVTIAGSDLVLGFSPGLTNRRTYRLEIGPGVSSIAGQAVEVRGLIADVNSSRRVDSADRSAVVAVWTGSGYSIETDVDLSGETNSADRSAVIAHWTGSACAP